MRKRWLAVLLALFLLAGCKETEITQQKGTVIATTGRSDTSQAEQEPSGVMDKHMLQMLEDFTNPFCKFNADNPETKGNSGKQVQADDALTARIASVLTQSMYEANIEKPVSDPTEEARVLTIEARDGKRYSRVTLYGFPQNHPFYAGKTMMILENDSGATSRYLYDATVFEEIDQEISTRVGGIAVQFTGSSVRMRSKYDLAAIKKERGLWSGEFLQLGNAVLWRFAAGDPATEDTQVELLSAVNGSVLQSYSIPEPVRRMEKYEGPEGGDYRLFTPSRVIFRDSSNPGWKQEWVLPGSVNLFTASEQLNGGYDLRFGKLAYAAEDGIYVGSETGGEEQLLLAHSALDTVMAGQGSGWYFNDPRFMLDGDRLVCSIVSAQTGAKRMGFAVSNLTTFETTYFTDVRADSELTVRYINDRMVAAQESGRLTLLDAQTMEKGALPLPRESDTGGSVSCFSEDYQKFVVFERSPEIINQSTSSALYLCESDALDARDTKLISVTGDIYYPVAITENYLIGYCEDSLGIHFTATQYDKRKKPTGASSERLQASSSADGNSPFSSSGASSSSSAGGQRPSSSSSSDWEDGIGSLPPDITPDWMQDLLLQSAMNTRNGNLSGIAPYLSSSSEDDSFLYPYKSLFE